MRPYVIPNLFDFLFWWNIKEDIWEINYVCPYNASPQKRFGY